MEAALAVALPLALTTRTSAVLAVTTSAVLDVLALKPLGHIVAVLDVVITPTISYTQLRRIDPTLSQRTSTPMSSAPSLSLFQEQQTVSIFPFIYIDQYVLRIE